MAVVHLNAHAIFSRAILFVVHVLLDMLPLGRLLVLILTNVLLVGIVAPLQIAQIWWEVILVVLVPRVITEMAQRAQ